MVGEAHNFVTILTTNSSHNTVVLWHVENSGLQAARTTINCYFHILKTFSWTNGSSVRYHLNCDYLGLVSYHHLLLSAFIPHITSSHTLVLRSLFPGHSSSPVLFFFPPFQRLSFNSKVDQREEVCGGVWNQTQSQQVAFFTSVLQKDKNPSCAVRAAPVDLRNWSSFSRKFHSPKPTSSLYLSSSSVNVGILPDFFF